MVFREILKKQLILKDIITEDDWEELYNDIQFNYSKDNHFTELKDAEILRERLQTLDQASQYVGEYFSKEWAMKNILMFSEDDIKDMGINPEEEPQKPDNEEEQ